MLSAGYSLQSGEAHFLPHITQLKLFSSVGTLLKTVTSLKVTLRMASSRTITQRFRTKEEFSNCNTYGPLVHTREDPAADEVSVAAYKPITSFLADACPKVTCFCVGGNLGEIVVDRFAALWPSLTKLEILEDALPANVLGRLFQQLPRLTHFTMSGAVRGSSKAACSHAISTCGSLTHLFVGWNILGVKGIVLPAGLKELSCTKLPYEISRELRLRSLEHLHVTNPACDCLEIAVFAGLCRAAEKLNRLSCSNNDFNSVYLGPSTGSEVWDVSYLNQKLAGNEFTLTGFRLKCGHSDGVIYYSDSEDDGSEDATTPDDSGDDVLVLAPHALPGQRAPLHTLRDVLKQMPTLCRFKSCTLSAIHGDNSRKGCIAKVLGLVPDAVELFLAGPWRDAQLPKTGIFSKVEEVHVTDDTLLSSEALQLLKPRMPNLVHMIFDGPLVL